MGMAHELRLEGTIDQNLIDLMEKGPEQELGRTIYAQQAIFAVSNALWERSGLNEPTMVMGHSLGEYMALSVSGALSVRDAMSLVKNRASFMEHSMPEGTGGMAAVLGLSPEEISEVIDSMDDLWVANINQARQVVIAGSISSLHQAEPLLKERGAKRVLPLKISVASHCPYMEPARKALKEYLKSVKVLKPSTRVVFNATAGEESDPDKIKTLLADQLVSPVRWEESVRHAVQSGIRHFIEIGPRSVLAPLIRRIVPGAGVEVITAHEC